MADPGPFKLSPLISKAAWDKQKGIIAKVFKTETGIGKAIDMVTASHKQVVWERFRSDKVSKKDYEAEYATNVKELISDLDDLENKCVKVGSSFKKNPLIPKSSSKVLADIGVEAAKLSQALAVHYDSTVKKLK